MSVLPSMMPYNPVLTQGVGRLLTLNWKITAAKTVSALPIAGGAASMVVFDAIAAQSTIDNFLGTTNEFLISQFDATAMGANATGIIVNMAGQAADLVGFESVLYYTTTLPGDTNIVRSINASTTLTASTMTNECAVGAYGNIALKMSWSGTIDALTSGWIVAKIYLISK